MKKSLIYSLLLIVLGSACLLVPHTQAEGDPDVELAETLRSRYTEQNTICEQSEVDEAWQLKNQAASRDADLVQKYLNSNPESVFHQCFSGMYIDEDSQLIILICGEEDTCRKQLMDLGLETEVLIKKEAKSYYAIMEELSQINAKISVINEHVLNGCGTDEECAFMDYLPCIAHIDQTNSLLARFAVTDEDDFAVAKDLFNKLVGTFEDLTIEPAGRDELNFSFY